MTLDTGSKGPNAAGTDILGKEYGYKLRWEGDAGEDPRKTSMDEFHSSTEEYSHKETMEASERDERPLMEDVEKEEDRSEGIEGEAGYHKE